MPEYVEKSGASIDEAVALALRELGVAREDVDVEVLAEARRSLFGTTKPARVRVGLKQSPDSAAERPPGLQDEMPRSGEQEGHPVTETEKTVATAERDDSEEELSPEERMDQLDQEADLAADFVEGLLDLLDLPGDIEIEIHEDQALVNLEDVGSGLLIGRRGATLDALQELVRCAVQRQTERRSRVRVDVEGYRSRHVEKLKDRCRDAIAQVRESGEPVRLEPMDAYERKLMHDLVAKTGGVASSSEGSEPRRRVVIQPEG